MSHLFLPSTAAVAVVATIVSVIAVTMSASGSVCLFVKKIRKGDPHVSSLVACVRSRGLPKNDDGDNDERYVTLSLTTEEASHVDRRQA